MKKLLTYLLTLIMILSICACGAKTEDPAETTAETAAAETTAANATEAETTAEETEEPFVGMANPWSDCKDIAEAEKIAGFTFSFRDVIGGGVYYATSYRAMEGMIDVTYEPEGGSQSAYTIRQAPATTEDICGDETQFSHDFTVDDAGIEEIRCRGTKDLLMICSFNYGDYSYVIYPADGSFEETFYILGELTGVDPTLYALETNKDDYPEESTEAEEPVEGAPVVAEGRLIDEEPIAIQEIAGVYSGINYGDFTLNVYSSPENNVAGNFEIMDKDGNTTQFMGEFSEYMTNYYGMTDSDVTFTVYSDNGNYGLDLYVDGKHADYFVMTSHFES